jgi:hypothetical protein
VAPAGGRALSRAGAGALSQAARALEATAYLIETHAPHAVDLPELGRHRTRERGNNER